ncbi:GrpB family protein [Paenibacillus sp. sptzw28]|uniref:GrpB family protein n=1 Tax=Paenibacillus sp. sptzw28 TaxID=715179 RepID=UPI001C6EFF8E|nr:GrpB family protein [Paenibacillus sp. sptzw28]QYR19670.1 GrpB family protein [Paenibacillus sp. sptzw28]
MTLGLPGGLIKLADYSPAWPKLFESERELIAGAVHGRVLDIQHIGSTSVPGMAAKPIIDIGVAVEQFELAAALVPALEAVGYVYRGENGCPRRHYFVKGAPLRTHHLHMLEIESADWRNHLAFRRLMRTEPEAAQAYMRLKRELAVLHETDRNAYQEGKSGFITRMIEQA